MVNFDNMAEYTYYFPAKVEKILSGDPLVIYVEFYDGNKSLVSITDSTKEVKMGDTVIVGRRVVPLNPPITKDEIIKILSKDEEKIYKEIKSQSDILQKRAKEIASREQTGIG
jgi:hypothetical protein